MDVRRFFFRRAACLVITYGMLGRILIALLIPVASGLFLLSGTALATELIPVRISTAPPGATIYVNGVPRGETPTVLHLPSGHQELFLYKEGMMPIKREVEWSPSDRPIMNFAMRPQSGGLVVISDPPRADAFLDGRSLGKTPLAFEGLPAGIHRLTLRRDGFDPYEARVTLEPESPHVVDARLSGPPVYLWVEAREGSHVYLNGSYAGQVTEESLGLRVRPGRHEVRMVHNGFASLQHVQLEPGRDGFVEAGRMHRIPGYVAPQKASLNPRWFGVAAGLGVASAGSVVMGVSLYQAHDARRDYDSAWEHAVIQDSRERVTAANRRMMYGALATVVGGAGAWLAWPSSEAPTVAWTGDALLLTWQVNP